MSRTFFVLVFILSSCGSSSVPATTPQPTSVPEATTAAEIDWWWHEDGGSFIDASPEEASATRYEEGVTRVDDRIVALEATDASVALATQIDRPVSLRVSAPDACPAANALIATLARRDLAYAVSVRGEWTPDQLACLERWRPRAVAWFVANAAMPRDWQHRVVAYAALAPASTAQLPNLRHLAIRDAADGVVARLGRLHLTSIFVVGREFTSQGLSEIAAIEGLRRFGMQFTGVESLGALSETSLDALSVTQCRALTTLDGVGGLALTWLDLSSTSVTDIGGLETATELRHARFVNAAIADLQPLAAASHLETLDLTRTPIEGSELRHLGSELRVLRLDRTATDDIALEHLEHMKKCKSGMRAWRTSHDTPTCAGSGCGRRT